MHKREEHNAYCGLYSPSVVAQKRGKCAEVAYIGKRASGGICHYYDGNNYLICGESKNKSHQDNAVKPQKPPDRVKKSAAVGKKRLPAERHICHKPDEKSGRCGGTYGASEDE